MPTLIPFNAAAKRVLEVTIREALRLGHNYVGTEHVLLALAECEPDLLNPLAVSKLEIEAYFVEAVSSVMGEAETSET